MSVIHQITASEMQVTAHSQRPEIAVASARASVVVYDESVRKWVPSGSSSGLSKVHIFQNRYQQTFRIVGRKLDDHEVVLNCSILKGLHYVKATPTFHQWRDNKKIYGLNFKSKEDADAFAVAMDNALENVKQPVQYVQPFNVVNSGHQPVSFQKPIEQSQMQAQLKQQFQQSDEDVGYRNISREDLEMTQERNLLNGINHQNINGHQRAASVPTVSTAPTVLTTAVSQSSVPSSVQLQNNTEHSKNVENKVLNESPIPPVCISNPPPPPPPPMPINSSMLRSRSSDISEGPSSLALQLQNAKLKKSNQKSASNGSQLENNNTSNSSNSYGTLGRNCNSNGSMASMMDEMAKTLARRRAAVEKKDPVVVATQTTLNMKSDSKNNNLVNGVNVLGNWEKSNTLPNQGKHLESPKSIRKRFGSASSDDTMLKINGLNSSTDSGTALGNQQNSEFENITAEILNEIKKEMHKIKLEIIEAIKAEINRR